MADSIRGGLVPKTIGRAEAICIIPNCWRPCPPHEAFCAKHRDAAPKAPPETKE